MGQKQSQAVAADDKKRSSSSNHQKQVQLPSGQVTTQPRRVSFNEADTNNQALGRSDTKGKTILSAVRQESDNIKIIKESNTEGADALLINDCIKNHFFMKSLDAKTRNSLIKEMSLGTVEKDQVVFSQGSFGDYFYILKEGEVALFVNQKLVKNIKPGESFGELALLHRSPRTGMVKATKPSVLYCLERNKFKKFMDSLNEVNFQENKAFIESIPILGALENDQKMILCMNLVKETYEAKKCIFKEGDLGGCIYIIKEGEVECLLKGQNIRTIGKGQSFGEISVLIDSPRTMDVYAKSATVLYSIPVEVLKKLVGGDMYREIIIFNFITQAFEASENFSKIEPSILENTFSTFKVSHYRKNDIVICRGYKTCSKILILAEGNLLNSTNKQVFAKKGTILFEEDIVKGETESVTSMDLVSESDVLICEADVEIFTKAIGYPLNTLFSRGKILESINKVPLFKQLSEIKKSLLIETLKKQKVDAGKNIITQGEDGSRFYIIKKGKVDIYINKNYQRTLNKHEYFGDRALFFDEKRSATAVAKEPVTLYVLEKDSFQKILDGNLKDYLLNHLFLQDNTITLQNLSIIKKLGNGSYGQVFLVHSNKNNFLYALKIISRKQIDYEKMHPNFEMERKILLQVDHPFIVKMVKSLKDTKYIFFLMEYIKGQELFDIIREIGILNKKQNLFYGGSIMIALDYLHSRKFIYRDIKPENIMVLDNGYIKLIDFGTAKQVVDRTSTIIGTPHYMAPELLFGEGYSFSADFWSCAVCMYEFICGGLPFGENEEDPMNVYRAIIKNNLIFPKHVKDLEFKHLMKFMLCKDLMNRVYKLKQVKLHPYFKDFDWEALKSLNLEVPFVSKKITKEVKFTSSTPYDTFIKTHQDWVPKKGQKINEKDIPEFEKWFAEF